ncbi:MAG: hypothetical protein ACTHMG_04445 [Sphingomonas sp.]
MAAPELLLPNVLRLGITTLPGFVGDADPLLVRVPEGETRTTKRMRLFTDFTSRRLAAHAALLTGLSTSGD